MPTPRERLDDVIARLIVAIGEYKQNTDPTYVLKANPPARSSAIADFEKHLQLKLPPLYREFLSMYNGYVGLACPGSMLSIADLMPGSARYKQIQEWKTNTAQYGGGEVIGAVVIAEQGQPNDWAYLDPDKPAEGGEWGAVLHLGGDPIEFEDLVDFLESRIKFCRHKPTAEEPEAAAEEE